MADALKDYAILEVAVPVPKSIKPEPGVEVTHTLYIRPHEPKIPTDTSSRSLFVVNVPVDATVHHFRLLLTSSSLKSSDSDALPKVQQVDFEGIPASRKSGRGASSKKRRRPTGDNDDDVLAITLPEPHTRALHPTGGTAVVLYASERDAQLAFRAVQRAARRDVHPPWPSEEELPDSVPALGSARYESYLQNLYPPHEKLQALVDEYMQNLSAHEQAQARAKAKARSVPDEDGFVSVTRGGRTGPARQQEAEEALAAQQAKEEKKRESMAGDFYRFQVRERRKQRERDLQEQFQGDVQRMKNLT